MPTSGAIHLQKLYMHLAADEFLLWHLKLAVIDLSIGPSGGIETKQSVCDSGQLTLSL
jgi:hypothetical protein